MAYPPASVTANRTRQLLGLDPVDTAPAQQLQPAIQPQDNGRHSILSMLGFDVSDPSNAMALQFLENAMPSTQQPHTFSGVMAAGGNAQAMKLRQQAANQAEADRQKAEEDQKAIGTALTSALGPQYAAVAQANPDVAMKLYELNNPKPPAPSADMQAYREYVNSEAAAGRRPLPLLGFLQAKSGSGGQPTSVQEYNFYAEQEKAAGRVPLPYADYQTQKGGAAETSLTPVWGVDTDPKSPTYNKPVLGQLNKAGKFIKTELPPGVEPIDPVQMQGDKTAVVVDAKNAGAARTSLPSAQNAYDQTIATLDKFDPTNTTDEAKGLRAGEAENFGKLLGIYPQQMAPVIPGTNRANFKNMVAQLGGQAFLNIRQALKGAGQVTDFEGQKGEIALSRMSAAADSGDDVAFKQAMLDYRQAIEHGMELLKQTAQGGYSQNSPAVTGTPTATQPSGTGDPELDKALQQYGGN